MRRTWSTQSTAFTNGVGEAYLTNYKLQGKLIDQAPEGYSLQVSLSKFCEQVLVREFFELVLCTNYASKFL